MSGPDEGGEERGRAVRDDPLARVLDRERAVAVAGPGRDFRLVFTNGCFDLLHRGHAAYLAEAATLGDRLIVAVNSDSSVRRIKGPGRPVLPEGDRTFLLASFRSVDWVTVFEEDTPAALVEALRPDVLVKGADYTLDEVVGREVVEAAGGRVELVELVGGRSTSEILERILRDGEADAVGDDAQDG